MEKTNIRAEVGAMGEPAPSPRELVDNLRELINEAEKMIVETASAQVDETVAELRGQLEEKLDRLRTNYRDIEERVLTKAAAADRSIREKPYQALGIAAGLGAVFGWWMARRK